MHWICSLRDERPCRQICSLTLLSIMAYEAHPNLLPMRQASEKLAVNPPWLMERLSRHLQAISCSSGAAPQEATKVLTKGAMPPPSLISFLLSSFSARYLQEKGATLFHSWQPSPECHPPLRRHMHHSLGWT